MQRTAARFHDTRHGLLTISSVIFDDFNWTLTVVNIEHSYTKKIAIG